MKTKNISRLLLTGVILNSLNLNSFASILSEDGRYETFEGNNITIDNILEEDEVDVKIEGNTMVNVANQKDLVPITKAYTIEGTNHIPLQGEYDGKARPVIEGNTMYYNNDTGELSETFKEGGNLSLVNSFEDQLVTQEMVDNDEEKPENLGKYKVEYKVTGKNNKESIKTFYLNSPLLEGDTIEDIDGKATHIRRSEKIVLDGSEDWVKGNVYGDSHQFVISRPSNMKSESAVMSNSLKSQHNVSEIGTCYSGTLYFNVFMPETTTIEYKQWLSENPMTVVYELAEPIYEIISEESILIDSYVDGHLDLNTSIPVNKVDFVPTTTNLNYLYPSTEYTVQFESDNEGKIDEVSLSDEILYSNYTVNKGANRFNIITPSEISSTELILDGIGFNLSNLVVTEGVDESFNYFEGIKSVGQDDVSGHNIEVVSTNSDKTQSNKIKIPLKEPLRGLPNGVKDRIIKRNGQWVVERNCGEYILDGSEDYWIESSNYSDVTLRFVAFPICEDTIPASQVYSNNFPYLDIRGSSDEECVFMYDKRIQIFIKKEKVATLAEFKSWLSNNPVSVIYQLSNPVYEPLNVDSVLNTYLDTTHILNNSTIPANMKITVDRTMNRTVEAIELAKTNPTVANISQARMWSNLIKESTNKDSLQNEINNITNIEDLQLERKTATSNVDVYIKSENMLLMSLSTNNIAFNDYSGVEDMELNNAINISINSSLPYQLNSYLLSEIENSDKSNRIEKDLLNIKSNIDNNYKTFNDINEKLVLEDGCDAGNNKSHSIDLKLKGSQAHKADIYKTVIKFEAEQK